MTLDRRQFVDFSDLYRQVALQHRTSIQKRVEFPVLAAGIDLWRQIREKLLIEFPANEFRCQDLAVNAGETCKSAVRAGIEYIAFGDLFLTDIRAYREKQLENSGLQPIFPVWGLPTQELALSMIESGMRAKLTLMMVS